MATQNNSSDLSNDTSLPVERILETILLFGIAVFAIVSNGLLLYVICSKRNLHNLRNAFVANLAAADLLLAATDIIYQAIERIVIDFRPPHASLCYIILLTGVLFGAASVFNLTAMNMVRYISICYPLHFSHYLTLRRSAAIVVFVWIAAFCLAFPPLIWRPDGVVCSTTKPSGEHFVSEVIYMSSEWLFWFFIPAILIFFSYYRIYAIARSHARKISALEVVQSREMPAGSDRANSLREKKAGRMVTILFGFWVLCWMPFFIVLTISKFKSHVPAILMRLFLCLMFANSAINPIVLTWYNRELKEAIKKVLCYKKQRHSIANRDARSMAKGKTTSV